MNLQSEIEYFNEMVPADKAGFLTLLMHELAEEARATYGPGSDQVSNPPMLRFVNELQHRISRLAWQILAEDTSRPADDVVVRMLLSPRSDKAAERLIVNAYRRALQGYDRHSTSTLFG
jgi:hypothetical protein